MAFIENQFRSTNKDEEDCLYAIQLATASVMPVVMQQAMELELFQTIAKAGEGAQLSASEIASQLSTTNPEAPMMIHRILRLLTSYSVLTSSVTTGDNGHVDRVYGLAPVCKYLIPDKDGVGLSSTLCFLTNDFGMRTMFGLKGTILEGGMTFSKVHGVSFYEYMEKDPKYAELFNKFIFDETTISMRKILEEYKGFEDLKVVVDVAGGMGAMSSIITRKYPSINCINFDLPRVIQLAPSYPRVKHVGGDMFVNVPKADAAILKRILHNWSDDDCVAILKKCYEAVPDQGNVIVLDAIVPEVLESNTAAKGVCQLDILMMAYCPGGRQRTLKEFEYLAKEAGFGGVRLACLVPNYGVLEFYKTI